MLGKTMSQHEIQQRQNILTYWKKNKGRYFVLILGAGGSHGNPELCWIICEENIINTEVGRNKVNIQPSVKHTSIKKLFAFIGSLIFHGTCNFPEGPGTQSYSCWLPDQIFSCLFYMELELLVRFSSYFLSGTRSTWFVFVTSLCIVFVCM